MACVETRFEEVQQVLEGLPLVGGGRARSTRWGLRLCLACRRRRPLFCYRGVVKADRHHNLCFECYRAELNRLRARRLGAAAGITPANPRPSPSKLATDRAALLLELNLRRRRAQMAARHALELPEPARFDEAAAC